MNKTIAFPKHEPVLSQLLFRLKMGGSETIDDITANLNFPFNTWINRRNFPLKVTPITWEEVVEIIDPGTCRSEADGLRMLKKRGLLRPTYECALRFAKQHGRADIWKTKPFILFLHDPWQAPDGSHRVLNLACAPKYHELGLIDTDKGFDRYYGHYVLAGLHRRNKCRGLVG